MTGYEEEEFGQSSKQGIERYRETLVPLTDESGKGFGIDGGV